MRSRTDSRLGTVETKIVWSNRCQEHFTPWRIATDGLDRCDLIAEAGVSDLYPGYELGRENPRFHLLVYTSEGTGDFFTPSYQAPVGAGYVLLVPAGRPFGYRPSKGRWRFTWVHLPDEKRWARLRELEPQIRRTSYWNPINAAMQEFLRENRSRRQDSKEAAGLYAQILALHVERDLGMTDQRLAANLRVQLDDLWQAVSADLRHPWTVETMAEKLHMSAPSLHRISKKFTNVSPMKMVQRLRMERAQELLILHDYPIAKIAEMVGYQNEFAFATAFKHFSGDPPARFRKRR